MRVIIPAVWLATTIVLVCADNTMSRPTLELRDNRAFLRNSEPLDKREEERSPSKVVEDSALQKLGLIAHDHLVKLIINHSSVEEALKSSLMPLAITARGDITKLLEALTMKYGFENVMLRLLDTGHSSAVQEVVDALLKAQIIKLYEDGYSAVQLFNELKISTNADVLNDRFLLILEGFLQFSNSKKRRQKPESLFSVLASKVEEGVLADSVAIAKMQPMNVGRAYNVENELVMKWIEDKELHPLILLKRLEMDQGVDKFVSLRLSTVAKYINKYKRYHPEDKFSLLQWATDTYSVVPVLKALKEAEGVEEKQHIATNLLNDELKMLLGDDNLLKYVIDLLDLKGDELLKNQELLLDFLVKKLDVGPLAMFLATRLAEESHDKKLCSDLLKALLHRCYGAKISPEDMYHYFGDATEKQMDVLVEPLILYYQEFFPWHSEAS